MPHLNYELDYCVEAFIVFNNKVLLRIHDKYNIWLSVGGHVELGEDLETALKREISEEVGLKDISIFKEKDLSSLNKKDSKFLALPRFIHRHKINETHDHLAMVFFVKSVTDKLKLIEDKEITSGCKWFTKEEIESDKYELTKDVKYMALDALSVLKN